jgi:hypothetical protein
MISEYLVDYKKSTQIDHIEYDGLEQINPFTQKLKIYNPEIDEPLHCFWYHIPCAKIFKKTSNQLYLALSHKSSQLIESIANLDARVDMVVKQLSTVSKKTHCEPSIITASNFPPIFVVRVDAHTKCFDWNGKPTTHMRYENSAKVQAFVEFDSVAMGSGKIERKWRVMQIKQSKPLDMSVCVFGHDGSISALATIPAVPIAPTVPRAPIPMVPIVPPMLGVPMVPAMPTTGSNAKKPDRSDEPIRFVPPDASVLRDLLGKLKKTPAKQTIELPDNTDHANQPKTIRFTYPSTSQIAEVVRAIKPHAMPDNIDALQGIEQLIATHTNELAIDTATMEREQRETLELMGMIEQMIGYNQGLDQRLDQEPDQESDQEPDQESDQEPESDIE